MQTCSDTTSAVTTYLARWEESEMAREAHLAGMGPIAEVEARLAHHYGKRHAVAMSSASMALFAIAAALDFRGVEFVTTPYTYGASLGGWLLLGNLPAFADIAPDTLTLDPRAPHAAVSPRTRAILAVDIYGHPSDGAALRRVADEHGIWYIADAAQSLGACRRGRPASVDADAIVVSFTVGKTLDAGEGGAVVTDNDDLYERLVWLTQHPARQKRELGLRRFSELGINRRMHPLAVAWAKANFDAALERMAGRRTQALAAIAAMEDSGLVELARFQERAIEPSFFRVTAAWATDDGDRQERLLERLAERGIRARVSPAPVTMIYRRDAFRSMRCPFRIAGCETAERQSAFRFCLMTDRVEGGKVLDRDELEPAGIRGAMGSG